MKKIVWDWNGTLLNDVELCLECINRLLVSHNVIPLKDISAYRNVFGFPIQNYYQKAGFDFNKIPYDKLAKEYMDDYQDKSYDCKLFDDVYDTLKKAKNLGFSQVILSASKKDYLLKQIEQYDISSYIDSIWGISDIYAHSKMDLARKFYETCDQEDEIWFVGDSLHDHEVASSINAKCILVTRGHQSKERLSKTNAYIAESALESLRIIYEAD